MGGHIFQIIALCTGTYLISVPLAYVCVPLLKLVGLVPVREDNPSWGTAFLWPLMILIGLFLFPIELVIKVHDKVEDFVKQKEESNATPCEPNPVPNLPSDTLHTDIPITVVEELCPCCNQLIIPKQLERTSKSNGAKR